MSESARKFLAFKLSDKLNRTSKPEGKDDVETKEPEAEDLGRKKKSSFGDDENLSKILHRRSSRRTKFG